MRDSEDKSKASTIRLTEIRQLMGEIDKLVNSLEAAEEKGLAAKGDELINSKIAAEEKELAMKGDRLIELLKEEKFPQRILGYLEDQQEKWDAVKKIIERELSSRLPSKNKSADIQGVDADDNFSDLQKHLVEELESNDSELVDVDDPNVKPELVAASEAKRKEAEKEAELVMRELERYLHEILRTEANTIEKLTQKYALCKECLAGIQNKDLAYEFNYNFKRAAEALLDNLPKIEKLQQMVTDINTMLSDKGEISKKDIRGILKKNFGDKNGSIPPSMLFLLNVRFPQESKVFRSQAPKADVLTQSAPGALESKRSSQAIPGTPLMNLKRRFSDRLSKRGSKIVSDSSASPTGSPVPKRFTRKGP